MVKDRSQWNDNTYTPNPGDIIFLIGTIRGVLPEIRTDLPTMWASLRRSKTEKSIPLKVTPATVVPKGNMLSDTMKYSDSEYRRIKTDATRTEMFGWRLFLFYAFCQSDKVV